MDASETQNRPASESEARDSSRSPITSVVQDDENQSTVQLEAIPKDPFLPLERAESLEGFYQSTGTTATHQQADLYDGLITVEGQNLAADLSDHSNPILDIELDEEDQQLQANFQTLLQRPTFFTSTFFTRPWLSQDADFYTRHDEPSFVDYFQQSITGLSYHQSRVDSLGEDASPRGGTFEEGLIPSEHRQTSSFQSGLDTGLPNAQSLIDSNSLSQNLLSILQRPTFLASPSARWTAPPQWLQFQLLRSYDEGLMVSENQGISVNQPYSRPTDSIYVEEVQSQVQINLHGLLQNHQNDSIPAAATRWEIPESWAQSSMGDFFPIRPPIALERDKYLNGLMLADRRANDPYSTPAVTCNFGLMQQVGFGERKLEFFAENFNAVNAGFFTHRVQSQAANTVDLMYLIITDWQPWFAKPLQEALPDFPVQTLLHFSSPQSASMLPSIDYNEGELTCIMEHINTRKASQDKFENEREIDVGTMKAHCLPLVVWTRTQGAIQSHPERPLIVIVSRRTDGISSKVINHYSNDGYKRWDRLAQNQAWVYLDLYFLFTKWDRIWGAVKQNLQRRTKEVHARQTVLPIQQQTRQLHKDNNIMISLREHVRIHKASLKIVMQRVEYMLGGVDFMATQGLKGRLDDAFQLLEYYEVTATTLLEQQQNLLSLAFNLETVAQGQAVARLNALAFIFLPLSLVASVFGITTFTVQPKWFPVAAVPTLLATIFIAYAAHLFFASTAMNESQQKSAKLEWTDDLEKFPTTGSESSASTWVKFTRIFSRSRSRSPKQRALTHGTMISEIPSINDPSRLVRRSTDRSLVGRHYIPPRSTVQFLPGAYDFSNVDSTPYYSSLSAHATPGVQAYDFATGSRPPYSPYVIDTRYYPDKGSTSYQLDYPGAAEFWNSVPVEADSRPVRTPLHELRTSVTPALRSPPPSSPQKKYSNAAELADNLETHQARAIFEIIGDDPEILSFNKDDIITVLSKLDQTMDWWLGRIGTRTGIFPRTYVEVLEPAPDPIPPPSSLYGEDGDETGYRPDGPDSFGLPPDNNEDLYSANDDLTSSIYPTQPMPLPQADIIDYGAEFREIDDPASWRQDRARRHERATDLQAALSGMGLGVFGDEGDEDGSDEVLRPPVRGDVVGRSGRRRVVTMETIEE